VSPAERDTARTESADVSDAQAQAATKDEGGTATSRLAPARPPSVASLQALQRAAGNRAVQRLASPVAVQRRRVPTAGGLNPLITPGSADHGAHVAGLVRVNERALAQMTPPNRAAVMADAHAAAGSVAAFNALSAGEQARLVSRAIRMRYPALALGDPALINTGPRDATETANVATLVANATALINLAISPAHNNDLRDVFGPGNEATARTRYENARTRMQYLHTNNRIVTDRSGYNAEVGLGGLTNANQIAISPNAIDNPTDNGQIVLFIHEAMHAGNPGVVGDGGGYPSQPSFTTRDVATKLGNAAHYEVVPRRIRGLPNAFTGVVFVPAGTTVVISGVSHSAPALTPLQQAASAASQKARNAWNMGLNLHNLWVHIHLNRADWTARTPLSAYYSGATAPRFADCMPFWSKVQKLTVHERPNLIATGPGGSSRAPVTDIDVALSEGLVRLVMQVKNMANSQLGTDASTTAFLNAQTTPAERAAATTVPQQTQLVLTALRRSVGSMTGNEARDVSVIETMAANGQYAQMLSPRAPAVFPHP
jgi:hypothetical protein